MNMKNGSFVFMVSLAAMLLCFAPASEVSAVGGTPSFADLNGTWKLIESGSSVDYRFTITMNGPVAFIVTETGYIAFGLVLPSTDGEHAFDIVWRFRTSARTGEYIRKYNGSVMYESCVYAYVPYVFPYEIEGRVTFPVWMDIEEQPFNAFKKNRLSVFVNPNNSGSIVSSDSQINTDNASTEALYAASCPPAQITLSAKPKTGYSFKHWKAGLTQVLTSNPLPVAMFEDMNITAVFEKEGSSGGSCCFYECRDENKTTNKGAGYVATDQNTCMEYAEDQCATLGVFPAKYGIVNCPDCSSTACFAKWENMWQ